ncbi:hypothetical protein LEP1GSC166_1299 [Leptospira kirschneri]|nr:hypothetical protein LEP1GSC166_1299 [Leptospira kirschneri]
MWSYVKKIKGGLDTRNIGESVVLSYFDSKIFFQLVVRSTDCILN